MPGGSGATGSGAEGSAGLVISRRAVLLGAGAACVHAMCPPPAAAAGPVDPGGQINPAGVLTASDVHVTVYPTVQALW